MVKTQKSSSDVMTAGMTVGPKQARMNQSFRFVSFQGHK